MTDPFAWQQITTGPCTRSGNPATPEESAMDPTENQTDDRAPVRLAVIIQAFRDNPEGFADTTLPDPPEAA